MVKEVMHIDTEGGEGKYLGLPECFSGSKSRLLSFLREKLQGRINGWFAKSLSPGGKEVLLKSVGLGLPVFAMSVFKLPKNVCSKLTSALIEFWWSSGSQRKKISWVAWQKLCKSKSLGGLGFKDIEKFNQALLAKQAWRVWSQPDSLLSRILKHRYFPNGSLLQCSVGTRPSFAWRSLLFGRDLLKQGLLRSIGDGANTNLWMDNWIMDSVPRPPLYRQDVVVDLTLSVNHLIDPVSGTWDEHQVRSLICIEDVPRVLRTPLSRFREDSTVWCLSKDGVYSSKSGYQFLDVLQTLENPQHTGLPPVEKQLWSNLWKSKTSPKLRHFLWRTLSGALAVRERLRSRGIPVNPLCPVCGAAQETICHTLFTCPIAVQVWSSSGFPLPPNGFSPSSVMLNLHHLISASRNTCVPELTRLSFPWILWHIWKSRNRTVFDQVHQSASHISSQAISEAQVWLHLHGLGTETNFPECPVPVAQPVWCKPPDNVVKCNVGVSWVGNCSLSGAAWIVRNHLGVSLFHSRRSFSNLGSQVEAELWSFLWAVESLNHLKVRRVIFESTCSLAREAFLQPDLYPHLQPLLQQVLFLLTPFTSWSFAHVCDQRNQVATKIAASVTSDGRSQSYVARAGPIWLQSLLAIEAGPTETA